MGAIAPINIGSCDLPLAREEVNQTPLAVIAGVTTRFKRRRVFTPAITHAPTPPIEAPKMLFPPPMGFYLNFPPIDKIFLTMSNMYFFSLSKDACGF